MRSVDGDRGAVTAETAVALPLIALFTVSMAWLVSVGITQVRALDAARETARAAARSEGRVRRRRSDGGSPRRARAISLGHGDGTVVVRVEQPGDGPAGLFGHWAVFRVEAEAVAAQEPTP